MLKKLFGGLCGSHGEFFTVWALPLLEHHRWYVVVCICLIGPVLTVTICRDMLVFRINLILSLPDFMTAAGYANYVACMIIPSRWITCGFVRHLESGVMRLKEFDIDIAEERKCVRGEIYTRYSETSHNTLGKAKYMQLRLSMWIYRACSTVRVAQAFDTQPHGNNTTCRNTFLHPW